jgi:hypothetical protein
MALEGHERSLRLDDREGSAGVVTGSSPDIGNLALTGCVGQSVSISVVGG